MVEAADSVGDPDGPSRRPGSSVDDGATAARGSPSEHLSESELADGLVHHTIEYKLMIDTVRIACANAESELAARVGAHLRKPAEAKRVLRNLFLAPGRVRVGTRTIAVDLAPATTTTEYDALSALLTELNRQNLTLPGDRRARRLRFRLQT